MIVYFWGKGKAVRGLLIGAGVVACLYAQFVYRQLAKEGISTLQVVSGGPVVPSQAQALDSRPAPPSLPFVASKRGTYYYPVGCSRAKTLSAKNTLYFKDISEAEAAGYKPYSGC